MAAPVQDPDRAGNTKVTAADWLRVARDTLVDKGVAHVKILGLARELGVSRSSFYWYFQDRGDILNALLDEWEARNTRVIVANCALPASGIAEAVCNFFTCFVDDSLFDQALDFAVRDWARTDDTVRAKIDAADARRLGAVTAMFTRDGYPPAEADARARILYYMQLGYHALDVREDTETRLSRIDAYLAGFTGRDIDPGTAKAFIARARQLLAKTPG